MKKLRAFTYSILRKTELYTKIDMIYFTKGGFWFTLTFVITAVASFLLTIVFANYLDKESYGLYKYVFSVYGILGAISFSSLDVLIVQTVTKGNDGVLRRAFSYSLKWNIPFLITTLGIAGYYYLNTNLSL